MFKSLISCCTLCLAFLTPLSSDEALPQTVKTQHIPCAPQLQNILQTIQQLPDAKQLISNIQYEGPISITINNTLSQQFGAYWDPDRRIITVSYSPQRSAGSLIGSIIFEMHNALVTAQINHLDALASNGQIDRDNYVRSVEHLEYENSLKASQIVQKGIQQGLFPQDAFLPTYNNFEEHYYYQRLAGHSAWISRNYDQIRYLQRM